MQIFAFFLDTGRKLNVHNTFRRRSEHLPNVLCTFNLRHVFRGLSKCQCVAIPTICFNAFQPMVFSGGIEVEHWLKMDYVV